MSIDNTPGTGAADPSDGQASGPGDPAADSPASGSGDPADSPFRHERTARDEAPQFVLPLVVRIEKAAPPTRTDALEAAARAVLLMLADERSTGGGGEGGDEGEWARAMRDWQDARIRKVVRRARGGEWRKASGLPGITVTSPAAPAPASAPTPTPGEVAASPRPAAPTPGAENLGTYETPAFAPYAEVRVFPPVPLDGWPKELAKLQVSGTELDDPAPPPAADPATPVLWLNPDLGMSAGKAMAQAGHGAQLAWYRLSEQDREAWCETGFTLAVRTADPARWRELTSGGLPLVRDAGFTEIAPGSSTVVADHPALRR
ncbi:peptidyl-tRNA hydrolase [Streptomyces sp. NBC_01498]|uniref:aminoacyl-tRNA hydrolase n=1 Tax=Streptomyces sp. NBC_01498 TaxID=2975870 RepID=UPI002E7BD702|nr:aminoacyl-tRNA hydrolase [Streptomyces sp. NBC_01498]WTL24097.1 peptidyl-tRNA hydrolase [Streptomyces sp. NBC_01498]